MDLPYDHIDQDQLRSGLSTISPVAASRLLNEGNPQEVEKSTVNDYVTFGANYIWSPDWKVNLQIPFIMRRHETLGTGSDGFTPAAGGGAYDSSYSEFGDVKTLLRYQGFSPQHNLGVVAGFKWPTGRFNLNGTSTDPSAPGPVAIDRGLQPGTGTTDLILGLTYNDALTQNWDYFLQGYDQVALDSRDDYRPGDGINLNVGVRDMQWTSWTPIVQINTRIAQHDTGLNADRFSTGGTLVYLSPGVSVALEAQTSLYAFMQLPIYQYVEGVQLTPTYTVSTGVRADF